MNNDIVVLGYGLLGKEIVNQTNWDHISRKEHGIDFNKTDWYHYLETYDIVINCIANTDTYSADRESHWQTNYVGVMNLVDYCKEFNKKLIQISTDYIYAGSAKPASETDVPISARTWYSLSKLLADEYIQARSKNYLLIRTSFKKNPFPYPEAITTQIGNFDYVDKISELIIKLINKNATGIFNVGTKRKTIYNLAVQTNPDVIGAFRILNKEMPRDVTMNTSKMEDFLSEKKQH